MRRTISREDIQKQFSDRDYYRGAGYYRGGKVQQYQERHIGVFTKAECIVQGSENYHVELLISPGGISGSCDCPRCEETGRCKHLVAALLTYADGGSGSSGSALLKTYLQRAAQPARLARVVPRLTLWDQGEIPKLTFLVGYEKLYVVKSIRKFLDAVESGEVIAYGKSLTLNHSPGNFDDQSRRLITLARSVVTAHDHVARLGVYGYQRSIGNELPLFGDAFDRLFDLYRDQSVELAYERRTVKLQEKDPVCTMELRPVDKSIRMELVDLDDFDFYATDEWVYYRDPEGICRCSRNFAEKMEPFLRQDERVLWFTRAELPSFCACVLPEVADFVKLDDPEGLVAQFTPDTCIPCYYFDLNDRGLTARLVCRYGETEIDPVTEPAKTPAVKRDLQAEQVARGYAETYFQLDPQEERYYLEGDEKIYEFLSEVLPRFQALGEVFVSDRLQSRQFHPAAATVGVSVSQGLLQLDLDTGGFPPEELEALYRSMLQRRKYYKLADGRFLTLDGSGCETLAEVAHMMQLSPADLAAGQVTLPTYRSLYLDSALRKDETLRVNRDAQFRALVRRFKTVEDSDFTPPPQLGAVLRPYQRTGFRWLKTLEASGFGGILADEMGLGKTLQMIAFLSTVPRATVGKPSLILCPASLVLNWADEFARFAPNLKVNLILGAASERAERMESDADSDVWVTSYDLMKRDVEAYAKREFYCCTLDEGQFVKNQGTKVSQAVKRVPCQQRFVLTGTPIENRLSELWNLFDFLMPGYLFSHSRFVEKLEKPIVQSQNEEARQQLSRLVQPFLLRRLKGEVLKELPPKLEYVRRVELSQPERKLYLAATAAARGALGGGEKLQILAALTRLRQICCDPGLCFENYEAETSKLEACVELCTGMAENGHQILLFSQFTTMLDRLRTRLESAGLTTYTIQGSTPKEKRAQLVRDFNRGGAQVFLISLKAGGTGLNLTAADVVIHYDPWWNQAAQNQATDRAHRIGQRSCVQVYKLIAKDTIEEKILDLQARKAELMDALSADGEGSILSMSPQDLMALLED